MFIFPVLMILGLAGLALMGLAGFGRHGHAGLHGLGQLGRGGVHLGQGGAAGAHAAGPSAARAEAGATPGLFWLIPSPSVLFSLLTLFGAFGYLLLRAGHVSPVVAGLLALAPTFLM